MWPPNGAVLSAYTATNSNSQDLLEEMSRCRRSFGLETSWSRRAFSFKNSENRAFFVRFRAVFGRFLYMPQQAGWIEIQLHAATGEEPAAKAGRRGEAFFGSMKGPTPSVRSLRTSAYAFCESRSSFRMVMASVPYGGLGATSSSRQSSTCAFSKEKSQTGLRPCPQGRRWRLRLWLSLRACWFLRRRGSPIGRW